MKNDFLDALKEMDNFTFTENGAVAYRSTGNNVLDAFGTLGSMMQAEAEDILTVFYRAFAEDRALSMKLLFYMRDIRGGQGLRRLFRIIIRSLAFKYPELVEKNLDNFLFFGRGDDLLCLFDTPVESAMIKYIDEVITEDVSAVMSNLPCSLLAKWLPSVNTSSATSRALANRLAKGMGMSNATYRKTLALLRGAINIVEAKMSANEWDSIDFEKLPSKASMLYADAFIKHCLENYTDYLTKVANGEANINAGALFPVDIIHKVEEITRDYSRKVSMKDTILYDALWKALPNFFGDTEETGICVVDTSGSMYGTPMEVALSLGMYCADKANGPFKNHFITFSNEPKLQEIKGKNIFEKVDCMERSAWDMNTNVEAVFDLILNTALANKLPQSDLPSKLYIISDMQFDECAYKYKGSNGRWGYGSRDNSFKPETLIQSMRAKYAENGYDLPALVYWNVRASKCGMFQEGSDADNCCMVSGYSPSLFKAVIDGTEFVEEVNEQGEKVVKQKIDPITVMLTALNAERYSRVYTGE